MPQPDKFRIGEIARIKDLVAPDDIWNGTEVMVMSEPYTDRRKKVTVVNIQLDEVSRWAIEPWNLEKITEEEYDAYIDQQYLSDGIFDDHRYLNPNGNGEPYDGRKVVSWDVCAWKPDPNFKRTTPPK